MRSVSGGTDSVAVDLEMLDQAAAIATGSPWGGAIRTDS